MYKFTKEEMEAILNKRQMTQELFDSIIDKCGNIGKETEFIFYPMLMKYEEYMTDYANRIIEKYDLESENEKYDDYNFEEFNKKLFKRIEEIENDKHK